MYCNLGTLLMLWVVRVVVSGSFETGSRHAEVSASLFFRCWHRRGVCVWPTVVMEKGIYVLERLAVCQEPVSMEVASQKYH